MTTVYEVKHGEIDMYTGHDGDERLQKLREHITNLSQPDNGEGELIQQMPVNLMPYTFYENVREPVMVMISNGTPSAVAFPDPDNYGATAADRYSQSIVYRDGWVKFLQLRTKSKLTWMQQAKRLMVIVLPIVIILFLVFIMALSL